MPKRKRNEPGLDEKLIQWRKELVRGLKTAKGFERQRLSKRIREADPEKKARLEREVAVLKSLDLHQAANAHLCSSLLRIKGVSESPKLPPDIKAVSKPTGLTEEEKTALHNVTSALCNRKQVKDVIEEAVMRTCVALRVPMPEKKGKGKGKSQGVEKGADRDEADGDPPKEKGKRISSRAEKEGQADDTHIDDGGVKGQDDEEDSEFDLILLKRQLEGDYNDLESVEGSSDAPQSPEFNGFSDNDAEERALARYDDFVGGSSSSDEDEEDSDDEGATDDDDDDLVDSRAKSIRKIALDDVSVSSEDPEQSDSSSDSDGSAVSPPPKKARSKAATAAPTRAGTSAFLPTLMGGYISGSESASDVDVAPVRKNRRGQRARQAIWEKKYGDKAKHHEKARNSRDYGWDMKRGAVGGGEDGDGGGKPWKKGIQNPFEKQHVHPQRQQRMQQGGGEQQRPERQERQEREIVQSRPKPRPAPKRDDTGPLHPSWVAAKKAKEESQKVAFQGKKVTFD